MTSVFNILRRCCMRSRVLVLFIIGLFLLNGFGCATVPEEHKGAAAGAGIGAATGVIAGSLLGSHGAKTEMAILGGLAGALVGGAIGHYAVDQKRTAQDTNNRYNYQSPAASIRIEETSAYPSSVNAGDKVDMKATYAVLGVPSGSQIDLVEKREITHEGQIVGNPEVTVSRLGGTYTSTVPLFLPSDAKPGMYTVRTTIKAANTSDSRESTFNVR
jgi:surface antigen